MNIGFDVGANVPSGVFALHAVVALAFVALAVLNGANGEIAGLGLNLALAAMLAAVGVLAGRIVARR